MNESTTNCDVIRQHVPIAICGYSYRLPGGIENDHGFYKLMVSRGYVQESVDDRYGVGSTSWDGFIEGNPVALASPYEGLIRNGRELEFDCTLFGISVHDAKRMDPQQKMMLMTTWEALQHAGMDQAALHNSRTGVFTGIQTSAISGWRSLDGATSSDVPGKSGSMIANRISFHFNWMGPSFAVATACSSGITALDAAIKSLDCGECNMAAFGAVHYLGLATSSIAFNALGIISKTGTSRSFDKDANGYMRAEGAFTYILKRLDDAKRDGDRIFGVIRGCALNCAGAENDAEILTQGRMIVAPVQHAQQQLMEQVTSLANIDPSTVDYIEAHATGTVVGDSVEGNAIANVYGSEHRTKPLLLASARSNLGHMEAASFTCSLLKVLLMLQKRQFLPISNHFKEPTDKIPFEARKMRVLTDVEPFPTNKIVRIGINSFGFGGANGHCLLEEYNCDEDQQLNSKWSRLPNLNPVLSTSNNNKTFVVPLSAKSEEALIENTRRLVPYLKEIIQNHNVDLYTLAGNLSVRMTHHRVRTAVSAATAETLIETLQSFVERADMNELKDDEIRKIQLPAWNQASIERGNILMVFPGQGAQWAGCGRELYDTELVFRRVVDAVDKEWMELVGCKLSDVAFDENVGTKLNDCCWAQPVTFLMQVGLYELFISYGIYPKSVLGHSAGEAAAAYACGAYSMKEACYLVYHRSRLQHALAGSGRMLVLLQDSSSTEYTLDRLGFTGQIEIACYNSPTQTVVCGAEVTIKQFQAKLEADGQPTGTLIAGNIAFHSRYMDPIHEELINALSMLDDDKDCRQSRVPMISTVTGSRIKQFNADYWWENVRHPVDLVNAFATAQQNVQPDVIIEVSPHITLRAPIRDYYNSNDLQMPTYIHTLIRKSDSAELFAQCIGNCYKVGIPVQFRNLYPRPRPITHLLPPYAMAADRVIDNNLDEMALWKKGHLSAGPMLGRRTNSSDQLQFESMMSKRHYRWMADHIVQGQPLIPAAGYLELMLEAFRGKIVRFHQVRILAPFLLTNDPSMMFTEFEQCPHAPSRYELKIFSRKIDNITDSCTRLHCKGFLELVSDDDVERGIPASIPRMFDPTSDDNIFKEVLYKDREDFYSTMGARIGHSFSYGPYFQGISKVEIDRKRHRVKIDVRIDRELWQQWNEMRYVFHPSMLDGVLQSFLVYVLEASDFTSIPQTINNLTMIRSPSCEHIVVIYEPSEYLRRGRFHQKGQLALALGEASAGNCTVYDGATHELIAYLGEYTSYGSNDKLSDLRNVNHYLSWQPKDDINAESVVSNSIVESIRTNCDFGSALETTIAAIIKSSHPNHGTLFFLNVVEFLIGALPEQLMLENCLSSITDAPVQYTVIAKDAQYLSDMYQRFGSSNPDANLRFANNDNDTSKGLLRPGMFELSVLRVVVRDATISDEEIKNDSEQIEEEISLAIKLAAPGGLMFVETNTDLSSLVGKWEYLFEAQTTESSNKLYILQVPPLTRQGTEMSVTLTDLETEKDTSHFIPKTKFDAISSSPISTTSDESDTTSTSDVSCTSHTDSDYSLSTSLVVDDSLGFSSYWTSALHRHESFGHKAIDFEKCGSWSRVDYFAMHSENKDEAPLYYGPSKLTDFVKEMNIRRAGKKHVTPCIFTIFTCGAMLSVTSPSQTGIWGAVRSLSLEIGDSCEIDFRLVDVADKDDLRMVRLCEPMRERELCIHKNRIWTSRLINHRVALPTVQVSSEVEHSFRLQTNNSGLLSDLKFRLEELPPLKPDEIEISVKAAALNFRDIMIGLGRLPLLSFEASMLGRTVGMECSGVVLRCGSEVTDHKVGDKVVAMQGGCIANRISCHEQFAYKLPSNLTFEEGSAAASVYVTAYYALVYLARMHNGQTLLVHSALGGVGQAAIALAKLYNVKVYGTAGSEEKRQALRSLGCVDAFDSHSTTWYHDLMAATSGNGVNIVLNSLAGEHVDLCLEALAAGGFHCEIGKVDIYADRPMKMSVFRKNIAFRAIDVDRLMTDDPSLTKELIATCLKLIEDGKVPPPPCSTYSYKNYHDAMRCMMNGQHRGKLVLVPPGPDEKLTVVDDRLLFKHGKDGNRRTVLMSGCLGGFGLRVLSYVVALGARNIVLMDRDPNRERSIEWVLDHSYISLLLGDIKDLRIEIVYGDVAIYEHVTNAVSYIDQLGMPPLGSVFHLAGVLDDKKVEDIDRDSFNKVYRPKANGAWNLHRATLGCTTMEHFVMFSSTSSVFGNIGQTNYSAANSFLDGLANMRLQQGLPALSFCMGAVIEAGMASRNSQLLQLMKAGGMPPISCVFAIEALDTAIRGQPRSIAVATIAKDLHANFDSKDYLRTIAQLIRNKAAFKMDDSSSLSKEALVDLLCERVGKLCGVDKLDPAEPFSSYGLNSISVAELATYLKNEMSYTVSAMELMTSATCESLADGIIQASQVTADSDTTKDRDDDSSPANEDSTNAPHTEEDIDNAWSQPLVHHRSIFTPSANEFFSCPALTPPINPKSEFINNSLVSVSKSIGVKATEKVAEIPHESLYHNLPFPCQRALSELNAFVDNLNDTKIEDAAPVKEIKRVLLTGATGFVGRHFIFELLNASCVQVEKIYCPVRAESDAMAKERLVQMLSEVGILNDELTARLHIFKADLRDESLGLSQEAYGEIVRDVDAVYHFASNLNLASGFQEISDTNCKSMRAVFKLCLTQRRKHLFLASTLGIFPQYFCQFTNEMTEKTIHRDAMPDVNLMKQIFPLGIGGYAWSKLIIELACYRAQVKKKLPLAVFRLPLMFTNSKTGYFVKDNPQVRLFFATLQLRLVPGTGRPLIVDDSAVSNEMMLRVSLNPNRRNIIYHCSYHCHSVVSEGLINDMLGFPCSNTTYENFKSKCMQLGSDSALNSYWVLYDHFSNYWVKFNRYTDEYPIDISTVEEDCYPAPKVTNILTVVSKLMERSRNPNTEELPFNVGLCEPSVDLESILIPSRKLCATYKIEFSAVMKPFVIDGLARICAELHSRQSMLPEIALTLTMRLEARVHLFRLLQLHPEIYSEAIHSPLFIIGLNRTGTTFLHRMLEASGKFQCPHPEDQLAIPKAEQIYHPDEQYARKRLAAIKSVLESYAANAAGIHDIELGVAEEDLVAHACSFMSLEYDVLYDLPNYRKWLENQDLTEVYLEHKTWMQFIAWWRRQQHPIAGTPVWCYKFPWHLRSLKQLLHVYPDARLVHTHRKIQDVASSWCSLVENQRKRFVDEIDKHKLGKDQLKLLELSLGKSIEFRKAHPEYERKWIDVQYKQLIRSPITTAKKVIAHAGLKVDAETKKQLTAFVEESLAKRNQITLHQPKNSEYGLSSQDFDVKVFNSSFGRTRTSPKHFIRTVSKQFLPRYRQNNHLLSEKRIESNQDQMQKHQK